MLLLLLINENVGVMNKIYFSILVFLVIGLDGAVGQYFTDIQADLTRVMHAGGTWLDKDDDGDLDLVITGGFLAGTNPVATSKFYTNINRDRHFKYLKTWLNDVDYGAADAGDYDNDGDVDVIITGKLKSGKSATYLYRNERNNVFRKVEVGVQNLHNGDVKFKDFNRDGNLDIAICGRNDFGVLQTLVYTGNGKGAFSVIGISATGIENGELDWGDFNLDGYYDLFITGENSAGKPISELYKFNGSSFEKVLVNFPGREKSAADWGDYDNDGDVDLVITGEDEHGMVHLNIIENEGNERFGSFALALPGTRTGSIDWGDFDHDGDIDILITGETDGNLIVSRVYRNDRNGRFVDINAGLVGVYLSDAGWGDYDNDGDLDLFLAGLSHDYKPVSKIYRNERIRTEEETAGREAFSPDAGSIWDAYRVPKDREVPMYYFMTSSCFCKPDSTYPIDGYHVFFSEVFRLDLPYYHQKSYFQGIIDKHERWGDIKGGTPSEGYLTREEAQKGLEQFRKSYRYEDYELHYVPWSNHPSLTREYTKRR